MADHSHLPNPDPSAAPEPEPDSGPATAPGIIDFLSMGVASALCLILGGGIGVGIDALAHTSPLWTFVGLGFGVVCAVLVTVAQVRKNFKNL
ncbi:MAG TPA: AtpZ/AtpI family protein [Acidimicrobiales bacterium]